MKKIILITTAVMALAALMEGVSQYRIRKIISRD
jgi:hypothetical protein